METLKTLIKIVHCIGGYELHYRVLGGAAIEKVWVSRPLAKNKAAV